MLLDKRNGVGDIHVRLLGSTAITNASIAQVRQTIAHTFEVRPNGLPFSRERAARKPIKNPTISRAKRSAATAGWAATRSNASLEPIVARYWLAFGSKLVPYDRCFASLKRIHQAQAIEGAHIEIFAVCS